MLKICLLTLLGCGSFLECLFRMKNLDPVGSIGFAILCVYATRNMISAMTKYQIERKKEELQPKPTTGTRPWPKIKPRRAPKAKTNIPRTSWYWLTVAASRIRAGEPESDVLNDYGYMKEDKCGAA